MTRQRMRARLKRNALEKAILRRNLTKTAFARLAGLHRTHLEDLLAGRTSPGPRTRQRLLDVLGGTFDDFFEIVSGSGKERGPPTVPFRRSPAAPDRRYGPRIERRSE